MRRDFSGQEKGVRVSGDRSAGLCIAVVACEVQSNITPLLVLILDPADSIDASLVFTNDVNASEGVPRSAKSARKRQGQSEDLGRLAASRARNAGLV